MEMMEMVGMMMGMMEMMGMANLFKHPLRVGDARSLLPALPPEGKKKLKRSSFFWIFYTVQPSCILRPIQLSEQLCMCGCQHVKYSILAKSPPHPPAPMNIRRKKLTKERIAQKHASILAANAIPTIFVENQSNSLKATYLLHLV